MIWCLEAKKGLAMPYKPLRQDESLFALSGIVYLVLQLCGGRQGEVMNACSPAAMVDIDLHGETLFAMAFIGLSFGGLCLP